MAAAESSEDIPEINISDFIEMSEPNMGYAELRERRCNGRDPTYIRSSGWRNSKYFVEDGRDERKITPSYMTKQEIREFKKDFSSFFNSEMGRIIEKKHPYLEQGNVGACSIMGTIALFKLYNRMNELNKFIKTKPSGIKWDKAWEVVREKDPNGAFASPSIAATWDRLEINLPSSDFVYVPVKPHENERLINNIFVDNTLISNNLLNDFINNNVDTEWRNEPALQAIFRKAVIIEYLLQKGYPLICNQGGHTRVAVYCDTNRILCVDSYGKEWQDGDTGWYWHDGYSVINKWRFYTDVKEFGFFTRRLIDVTATPQSRSQPVPRNSSTKTNKSPPTILRRSSRSSVFKKGSGTRKNQKHNRKRKQSRQSRRK